MRKKMIAVATASALTLGGLTVAPNEAYAQTQSGSSTEFGKGVEKAFKPETWKIEEGTTFKEFMQQLFSPYKMMFSGDIETSSEGATRAVIQYGIVFAIVTVVGQVIQLIMSSVRR